MRFLPALLLAFFAAFTGRLSAQGNSDPITLVGTIPSQSVSTAAGTPPVDLRGFFAVPTILGTNPVVQFTVPGAGVFNVEMKADVAPLTVANFLAYVTANRFTNTLVHRSNPTFRIFQGGGYIPNSTGTNFMTYGDVLKNAPLNMEAANTMVHSRGTIAMARTAASLNSATSEWFINTADNTSLWSPASALNSGSYAAFGRVTGTGLTVVDAIAALPRIGGNVTVISSTNTSPSVTINSATAPVNFGVGWTLLGGTVTSLFGNFVTLDTNANATITSSTSVVTDLFPAPFNELPILHNLASTEGPVPLADLVKTTSVAVVPVFPAAPGTPSVVTFTAVSSDPVLVKPNISGSNLYLAAGRNLTGTATVTVTATDTNGNAVNQAAFNVSVTRKVNDFNTDALGDFVFQNNAGQIAAWFLNGTGFMTGSATLSSLALGDYKIAGIADMNGDGNPDFVLQNGIGAIAAWYLNASGVRTSSAIISSVATGDFRVVAVADIDRDGNPDLILQNNIGQIAVWPLNASGAIILSGRYYLSTANLGDFRIRSVADLNGDGIPDVIFQNTIGQIAVWTLNATGTIASTYLLYGSGLGDWKIAHASDTDGDGITDLVFQNTIGQIAVWYLNANGSTKGTATLSGLNLGDYRLK